MFPHDIADDGSSLSEACSTPIIGAGSRAGSSHTVLDMDDIDPGHLATRSSLSSLGVSCDSLKMSFSRLLCMKNERQMQPRFARTYRPSHSQLSREICTYYRNLTRSGLHRCISLGLTVMGEPARSRRRTTRILRR